MIVVAVERSVSLSSMPSTLCRVYRQIMQLNGDALHTSHATKQLVWNLVCWIGGANGFTALYTNMIFLPETIFEVFAIQM